jgi:hypothetical protein
MPAVAQASKPAADIMTRVWQRIKGSRSQDYHLLPLSEKEHVSHKKYRRERPTTLRYLGYAFALFVTLLGIYGLAR